MTIVARTTTVPQASAPQPANEAHATQDRPTAPAAFGPNICFENPSSYDSGAYPISSGTRACQRARILHQHDAHLLDAKRDPAGIIA